MKEKELSPLKPKKGQTAVDWIIDALGDYQITIFGELFFENAKNIERNQIIEAFDKGKNMNRFSEALDFADETSGIDYYDIVYNK